MTFLRKHWILLAAAVLAIALGIWAATRPVPAPPMPPATEAAVQDAIIHDQAQVGRDTARAKAPAVSAATDYEAGSAYANLGKVLHKQSKPHAKPTPTDTAAERLQRDLSGY